MPFFLAAALQLVYMVLYVRIFSRYEPQRTESDQPGRSTS